MSKKRKTTRSKSRRQDKKMCFNVCTSPDNKKYRAIFKGELRKKINGDDFLDFS
jgi:hypothetical protein